MSNEQFRDAQQRAAEFNRNQFEHKLAMQVERLTTENAALKKERDFLESKRKELRTYVTANMCPDLSRILQIIDSKPNSAIQGGQV